MFAIFSIKLRPTKLSVRGVKNVLEIIRQLAIITIGDSRPYQTKCCIQPTTQPHNNYNQPTIESAGKENQMQQSVCTLPGLTWDLALIISLFSRPTRPANMEIALKK